MYSLRAESLWPGRLFKLQKGTLPETSQSYKIVDVTNNADKERQFELHVTVREHVPDRVATGVHAGMTWVGNTHSLLGNRMVQ